MPSASAVDQWLLSVERRFGPTKALICRLIISTGLRRLDAVEWPTRHLAAPEGALRWIGSNLVVKIQEGAKGGRERSIFVPGDMAELLQKYQKFGRQLAISIRNSQNHKKSQEGILFLSEKNGRPISAQSLYIAWTSAPYQPSEGWSPHLGRHYWACQTLLSHLDAQSQILKKGIADLPHAWVDEVGRSIIETVIQPQLGHGDTSTTDRYLRWLHHETFITTSYNSYHRSLEQG